MSGESYFRGPDGESFMLHNPTDAQVEALEYMGSEEVTAEEFHESQTEKMGESPTGGLREIEVEPN